MADLDAELSGRLSRLAAAVPVAPGRLDPVHARAVEARQRIRMAWMTPVVVLVLIVVGSALFGDRGEPGGTAEPTAHQSSPGNQVVHASVRSGDFELEIESANAWYLPGEPIQITASLTYVGPEATVRIAHGLGSPRGGPMSFGIVEPVDGLTLSTAWRQSCNRTDLTRDVPIEASFAKSGAFSGDDPRASQFQAFFAEPGLTLPVGTWHPYVVTEFSIGDCKPDVLAIRAEIAIAVVPPPPDPTDEVSSAVQASVDRDGPFSLELRASKARYTPDEAIDVVGTLAFDGPDASIEFKHSDTGPIVFGIRERVFGEIQVGEISNLMWEGTMLERNIPLVQQFQKGGALDGQHPDAAKLMAWMEEPVLRLPEGTWHLMARAGGTALDSRDENAMFDLSTEIEIIVDDPATSGHPSATQWADKPVYGGDDIGNMMLQVKSTHPTYAAGAPIDFDTYYWLAEGPPLAESPFVQRAAFQIVQVDPVATVVRDIEPASTCTETTVGRAEERHVPVGDGNVVLIKAVAWPQASSDALKRGILDLPVGRWRLTAVVRAEFGPCGSPTETWQVHASVEVDVLPRP